MGKKNEEDYAEFTGHLRQALEDQEILGLLRRRLGLSSLVPPLAPPTASVESPELLRLRQEHQSLVQDYQSLQNQLKAAEAREQQANVALQEQRRENQVLVEQRDAMQRDNAEWQQRWQDSEKALQDLRSRSLLLPAELTALLATLRQDQELQQRFALDGTKSDLDFLIQAVAVLADETSLRRLWEFYKDRCQTRRQGATSAERSVFLTALAWYNFRWPEKPYAIDEPTIGGSYQHDRHMLPPLGMRGEIIKAVWLPGVPGLKIKALVATELL